MTSTLRVLGALDFYEMLIIRTTDAAHAASGIQELAGQVVYCVEDMECVGNRHDLLRLRISALPLTQTLNQALHEKMVSEDRSK